MLERRRVYLCPQEEKEINSGYIEIEGIDNNDSLFAALRNQLHFLHIALLYSDIVDSSYILTHTYGLEVSDNNWLKWSFINSVKKSMTKSNTQ